MSNVPAIIPEQELIVSRAPEVVLEEARKAAVALKDVIDRKPNPILFNGEKYLEFEDWQTVGRFYGVSPKITSTKYVEYGEAKGWEASAEAVQVASGNIVSRAEAMCLNDEPKWSARPKYEWHYVKKSGGTSAEDPGKDELIWEKSKEGKSRPKKERLLVGNEAVPLFQLRSMAQTRACAKAMRNALAWVVVLAGFKPTPAEELDILHRIPEDIVERDITPPKDERLKVTPEQIEAIHKALSENDVSLLDILKKAEIQALEDMASDDAMKAISWIRKQKKATA